MLSILRLFLLAVATFLGGSLITLVSPLKLIPETQTLSYRLAARIAGIWGDFMRWLLTTVPMEYVITGCLLYTSPSPRDYAASRMPSSA